VSVPYKNEPKTFRVPRWSLWDWATDLVSHPQPARKGYTNSIANLPLASSMSHGLPMHSGMLKHVFI